MAYKYHIFYKLSVSNNPNFKKIPNHALTHYISDAYPTAKVRIQTYAGFPPRPQVQHKSHSDIKPKITQSQYVETPRATFKPKMFRNGFHNYINKEALAKYFDNDIPPSRAEVAQDKLDTWLMQTMFEMENADIAKAEQDFAEYEKIRAFVESLRTPKPTPTPGKHTSIWDDDDDEYRGIDWVKEYARAQAYRSWDEIAKYALELTR